MTQDSDLSVNTGDVVDYESEPAASTRWSGVLLECLVQVLHDLNMTEDLTNNLHDLVNVSYDTYSDKGLDWQFMNASLWNEINGSEWDSAGGRLEDCLTRPTPLDRPYLLPWWQQLTWTLAFGSMLLVAVGGNAIVMWIVIAHRRMRTVTNYFLVNLSAADLLMSVFNCIFNFIYMLHSDWPFGSIYCTISNFMANVTIAASVFTLMAISFDRYIAIVKPLKPRMSKGEARHFIIIIWVSSMTLAIPCLLYSTTKSIRYKNDEIRRGCFLLWPDGETSISYREYVYNIVFFTTTYLLPMVVMLVSYSLIGCELWGSHSIGELTDRQASSIKSKKRVVKMFMVIVVVFMLCWLPQQGFFLYQYHNSQVLDSEHIQHIYLGFYWLAMANAMINPVIYYWMNTRFRSYFREVVLQCSPGRCCCCCCLQSSIYLDSPHLVRRRDGSVDHTSRSRSDFRFDMNLAPRNSAAGKHSQQNHLFVYSSKGKLNARGGHLNTSSGTKTGTGEADKVAGEEDSRYKKPLTVEQDWHRVHYLAEQKTVRLRVQQATPRLSHTVNGVTRVQGEALVKDEQLIEALREEAQVSRTSVRCEAAGDLAAGTVSKCPPAGRSPEKTAHVSQPPDEALVMVNISKATHKSPCLYSLLSNTTTNKNIREHSEKRSICDTKQISEGKSHISKVNNITNCRSFLTAKTGSPLEDSCRSESQEDSSQEVTLALNTLRGRYQERRGVRGSMVHQAIEEALTVVTRQSCGRDVYGREARDAAGTPPDPSLNISKEIML